MPEDLKLSQIGSSQLPPPFRGLHSPAVRKHCQIIFACYFRKSSIVSVHFLRDKQWVEYCEEIPTSLVTSMEEHAGLRADRVLLLCMAMGQGYSGPGNDVFGADRPVTDPAKANRSTAVHPVLYYYSNITRTINTDEELEDYCEFVTIAPGIPRGAGSAQWLERRTRDQKVVGSNPCRSGGRIFFSRVNFLC